MWYCFRIVWFTSFSWTAQVPQLQICITGSAKQKWAVHAWRSYLRISHSHRPAETTERIKGNHSVLCFKVGHFILLCNYFKITNLFCLCLSLCGTRQSLCGRSMKECCACNVFSTTNELLSRTAWSSLSGGESRGLSYRAGMTMSDMTLLWLSEQ